MQVCLFNSTDKPIFVKEIGMTVGAKSKSRVLQEFERSAIVDEYPGLRFVDVMMEGEPAARPKPETPETVLPSIDSESEKPKRKYSRT